ncbi:TIGR04282 family arsenosugar biosynthesis glycosyltransferase [Aquimarina sp. 2201CG14-23]|uniref:TIGR04282 family arsenosugar biosynthesis glycosyltransferase n=1 Tax=Aquimarina mycalae TaxID=3040073 RepID=UPI002477E7C0|nr:DUF2064 domain-containing protein [Aquimarina sp. 2201CG14-23]MDH7447943.1 DUF2064 domain-containing protein [Aquimarina sp. 2201CG14-23]
MNLKTAILVFANSAQEELQHKPILGGEKLFDELNKRTLAIVESSKLPFYIFTEKNQFGTTFGERFVNAIQTIYDLGFDNVITIGNDTPHLKKHHLLESARQLQNKKFVLGPSTDGGFYLMGLHKSQFNPSIFLKLPWQSGHIAKRISLLIKTAKIEVTKLQVLFDIDTFEDLKTVSRFGFNLSGVLQKIIYKIIQYPVTIWQHIVIIKNNTLLRSLYNKGSPVSLSF